MAVQGNDSINTAKRKDKQKEIAKLHEKTFRAWINKQLKKKNLHIDNLFTDLEDGIMLIQILETLSGKTCPQKPTQHPKMEIQKLENITMGLEFAKTIFPGGLTMIQSKDILEANKNPKLLLGLVWQMILHFQVLGESDSSDKKSAVDKQRGAKEKLLKWCQEQTKGHAHLDISDLSVKSWGDGMGFCALVHAYNPDLIDYNSLNPAQKKENLQKAFTAAEKFLDIPPFLDPEDILNPDNQPDEQCFITYLSEFPMAFLNKAGADLKRKEAEAAKQEELRREEELRRKEEEARRAAEEAKRKEEESARKDDELRRKEEELRRLAADSEKRERELAEQRRLDEEAARKKREQEEQDARRRAAEEEAKKAEEEERRRKEKEAKKAAKDADRKKKEEEDRMRAKQDGDAAAEEERKKREAEKAFEEEIERMKRENEAIRNQLEGVKKKLIGKIQVTVVEARGLPKSDHLNHKSDPYCVLFLERQKEKTRTVKKTLNPKWQADFEFYVSERDAALEVSVFDWNRIFADELLGKTTIPVSTLKDGATTDQWFPMTGKEKAKGKETVAGEIRLILTYKLEK